MDTNKAIIQEIIKNRTGDQKGLAKIKRAAAKRHGLPFSSNIDLIRTYRQMVKSGEIKKEQGIEDVLQLKPIRSLSGIVNVSVLTKSYPCPGKCVFCPTEKGFPKGYLSGEPAADRAKALKFDPYLQTEKRIEALERQGHATDKIELRIIGGTFSFYPKAYQTWFIKRCFEACNQKTTRSLITAQRQNEKAKHRIVGLSIETRPDFITKKEILRLRKLGVTLVELGVQSAFDDVLKTCRTGTTIEGVKGATRMLKDAGFKVLYQMMPNLPGSDLKRDLQCFKILFEDKGFKPDWLKVYPCLICESALLYSWYKKGRYQPYSEKELVDLLIEVKKILPYFVRLTRLFRDIPAKKIMAGCKTSNLREIIQARMKKQGLTCRCLRCREVKGRYDPGEKTYLFKQEYAASHGKEIFLSFENKARTKVFSFLRLRISKNTFIDTLKKSSIIREVQTFGAQVPIATNLLAPQHKGFGKKLIKEAEEITKRDFGLSRIAAISGVGVREYYRKLGYRLNQTYMTKKL